MVYFGQYLSQFHCIRYLCLHCNAKPVCSLHLPEYEEQLELQITKEDLEGLQKDAIEAMETQFKRFEFSLTLIFPYF